MNKCKCHVTRVLKRANHRFDYSQLHLTLQKPTEEEALAIHDILETDVKNIVQIGLRLQCVHDMLGRDQFQAWITAEFSLTRATASNYMRVAKNFVDVECLDRFHRTALYVLSQMRVPKEARADALQRARNGETITKKVAEELVRKYHGEAKTRLKGIGKLEKVLTMFEADFRGLELVDRQSLYARLTSMATRLKEADSVIEAEVVEPVLLHA